MNIKNIVTSNLLNVPGWHTNRKIIVIESDDWGSIRMPSRDAYNYLLKKGIRVDKCPYCRYDSLATEEDLGALFEVLQSVKNARDESPVVTANCVVANPDFEKIKTSGFTDYFYEPFTVTLKRYTNCTKSFDLWKEGINSHLFFPQFHGREHVNVTRWMRYLRNGSVETLEAFKWGLWGLSTNIIREKRSSYMAAFDVDSEEELRDLNEILSDGLKMFERIFGFKSTSFIAANYIWSNRIEMTLKDNGILYIQGSRFQHYPKLERESKHGVYHYTGQKNRYSQIYTIRNCTFEPVGSEKKDWIDSCMKNISDSFRWKKPAIISSHRVNYIGSIDKNNRDRNLKLLKELLERIVKKWPQVEFMTSNELGDLMNDKKVPVQ